jgi:hypothetical protein
MQVVLEGGWPEQGLDRNGGETDGGRARGGEPLAPARENGDQHEADKRRFDARGQDDGEIEPAPSPALPAEVRRAEGQGIEDVGDVAADDAVAGEQAGEEGGDGSEVGEVRSLVRLDELHADGNLPEDCEDVEEAIDGGD